MLREYLSALIILVVVLAMFSGCAPFEGVKNGFFGKDHKATLAKMEIIVKNLIIVYDPSITDEDFEAWAEEHREQIRQFNALLALYEAMAPPDKQEAAFPLKIAIDARQAQLDAIEAGDPPPLIPADAD